MPDGPIEIDNSADTRSLRGISLGRRDSDLPVPTAVPNWRRA